jgi:hypothetical protein
MAIIIGNGVRPLLSTTGVSGTATGSTAFFTVPTGKTLFLEGVVVRCTAATAITVGATAQVETSLNAADIFASDTLTNVLASGDAYYFSTGAKTKTVAAGSSLSLNITVAATGTSQTFTIEPIGYLF